MADTLILQNLIFPLIVILGYALLAAIIIARRGVRKRESAVFASYLVITVGWSLCVILRSQPGVWSMVSWEILLTYLPIAWGFAFWDFARAFLRQSLPPIGGWLSAAGVLAILVVLDKRVAKPPPLSELIGATACTEDMLLFLSTSVAAVYTSIAVVTVLVEYARRPSPLHRNRIRYWLLGTTALIAGLALLFAYQMRSSDQHVIAIAGVSLHWLGAALVSYVIVQSQLPNVVIGQRRVVSYLFAALVPAAVVVGLSLGLAYLGQRLSFPLQLSDDLPFGVIIAGIIIFLLYPPLNNLMRSGMNRLFFGRGYRAQRVVREYSQAVSRIMSLKELTTTAMTIIDDALGIWKGTLLVVEEKQQAGYCLQVIKGLDVPPNHPPLILEDATPLSDWLVAQGALLHQYTMDVDKQFETLSPTDREMWRRLGMEIFIPVRRAEALIGLMALGLRRSGRPYTDSDLELLTTLAEQTAVALENASLFDHVQRRADQLALLNEIGQVITSSLDLGPALELIAARIESAFQVAAGFIFLLDESQNELVLQSAFGRQAPEVDSFRVQLGQGLVGWVAVESKPTLVSDLPGDNRYASTVEGVLANSATSALCVPVIAQGKTIGVILIVDPTRTSLGSTELNLLDSIAAFASIAIENARQVAAREAQLRRQVEELRIQIDEIQSDREVETITETAYFRQLQAEARKIQQRRATKQKKTTSDRLRQKSRKQSNSSNVK